MRRLITSHDGHQSSPSLSGGPPFSKHARRIADVSDDEEEDLCKISDLPSTLVLRHKGSSISIEEALRVCMWTSVQWLENKHVSEGHAEYANTCYARIVSNNETVASSSSSSTWSSGFAKSFNCCTSLRVHGQEATRDDKLYCGACNRQIGQGCGNSQVLVDMAGPLLEKQSVNDSKTLEDLVDHFTQKFTPEYECITSAKAVSEFGIDKGSLLLGETCASRLLIGWRLTHDFYTWLFNTSMELDNGRLVANDWFEVESERMCRETGKLYEMSTDAGISGRTVVPEVLLDWKYWGRIDEHRFDEWAGEYGDMLPHYLRVGRSTLDSMPYCWPKTSIANEDVNDRMEEDSDEFECDDSEEVEDDDSEEVEDDERIEPPRTRSTPKSSTSVEPSVQMLKRQLVQLKREGNSLCKKTKTVAAQLEIAQTAADLKHALMRLARANKTIGELRNVIKKATSMVAKRQTSRALSTRKR